MGFKKMTPNNENEFVAAARGETQEKVKKATRDKKILLYFTYEEFDRVQAAAKSTGMAVNQYIRFKLFN